MATDCSAAHAAPLVFRLPTSKKFIDVTGQRFGRFEVLSFAGFAGPFAKWNVRCDCGEERCVFGNQLRSGNSRSCGCLRKDKTTVHGLSKSPLYGIWKLMIRRCTDPSDSHFMDYGGRGIAVCERWANSVEAFIADMSPRPSKEHTIDRKDNDGPYSPENCRWATRKQQAGNTRRTRLLTFNGRTMVMSHWADELGITRERLRQRLEKYPVEVALAVGNMSGSHVRIDGQPTIVLRRRTKKEKPPKALSLRKCGVPRKETLKGLSRKERRERRRQMAVFVREGKTIKDIAAEFDVVECVVVKASKEFK